MKITSKRPSILKTSRAMEEFITQSTLFLSEPSEQDIPNNKMNKNIEGGEKKRLGENISESSTRSSLEEDDINETLQAIHQTLKRIRREKFNYYIGTESTSQTESELHLSQKSNEEEGKC